MYWTESKIGATLGKQVDVRRRANFSSKTAFTFVANPDLTKKGWTPTSLAARKAITSVGKLVYITLQVTTQNFNRILELIEAWNEAAVPVLLVFPITVVRPRVGNRADPTFGGLDTEECYLPCSGGFRASDRLKRAVRSLFTDDALVTVQP